MAVRLALQKPVGTDVAFVDASNLKADRVLRFFLKSFGSTYDLTAMSDIEIAEAAVAEIQDWVVKRSKRAQYDEEAANVAGDVQTAIAASPCEWD